MSKANENAFPYCGEKTRELLDRSGNVVGFSSGPVSEPGLTKRELAAMKAMQGLLSNWEWMRGLDKRCLDAGVSMEMGVARACRSYADALIKELEKESQ